MGSETGAKRLDIQGLRAVAVVAVILDHLTGWPRGGFVGVDVFFVISGFLITGLLLREWEAHGALSLGGFYRRRVKRIVPAATLVIAATLAASYALLESRWRDVGWDALASLGFVANWRFAAQGADYFQEGAAPSPLQHYWSLAVEEQFYLVWPWLLVGVLVVGRRGRSSGRALVGVAVGAVVVASLGWALVQSSSAAEVAYFSTLTRVWELGVGALVAVLAPWLARLGGAGPDAAWVRVVLAWAGLGGIVLSVLVVPAEGGFPAPWALLPVLSTALVIGAGASSYLGVLTNRVSVGLGEISYSLYLWHFPVIVLLPAVMVSTGVGFFVVALGLTVVLAWASYRWVEGPARRAEWVRVSGVRRVRPVVGWVRVASVAAALVVLAVVGGRLVGTQTEVPLVPAAALAGDRIKAGDDPYRCVGAGAMDAANGCPLNDGDSLSPPVAEMERDSGGAFACWIGTRGSFEVCSQGSERADALRVAVVGDSHAALLMPALTPSLEQLNWRVDSYAGVMCQWWTIATPKCTALPEIRSALETGEPYDLVITTSNRGSSVAATPSDYAEAWRPVVARGTQVVVVADVAEPSAESLSCVRRVGFRASQSGCGTAESAGFARPDLPVQAASLVDGVRVVDLREFLCVDGFCPAVIGNVIVYQDTVGHLTGTFARTLGPYLVRELERVVVSPVDRGTQTLSGEASADNISD
ncbi:acyltransferase family protein [Nocardioides pacificus]